MFSSSVGFIHTLFAVVAITTGGLVALLRKGTKIHKLMGYAFFYAMVIMNLTALFTQSIYSFGPFHWMAIGSLVFVTCGMAAPVLFLSSVANTVFNAAPENHSGLVIT